MTHAGAGGPGPHPHGLAVRAAGPGDLDLLGPLFDAYRRFYRQPSNLEGALRFLRARLIEGDSVVLLAEKNGAAAGFVQLYPSFSSVHLAPIYILNDLYVAETMRAQGAGRALLQAAVRTASDRGAARLVLETEAANRPARALYGAAGWAESGTIQYTIVVEE